MPKSQPITDIVLDFDGTCTDIPAINEAFLDEYGLIFDKNVEPVSKSEWKSAQDEVMENSPNAGWMISGCPSAPAACDPYILAFEAASLILRKRKSTNTLPSTLHHQANDKHPAPWRNDAADVINKILDKGIELHFISNSSTKKIVERLHVLFGEGNPILKKISVQSGAAKFRISELPWETPDAYPNELIEKFKKLPASISSNDLDRPIYLRRSFYFEAIAQVFKNDLTKLPSSVFCGDIWEMDHAMPYELGASVHLIEREAPYNTYDYERNMVESYGDRGKMSKQLSGVLDWL